MAESNLKETFYRQFNQDVATLRAQIENLSSVSTSGGERNEAIDNCLAGINRVALDVQDASSYLPAYDQRTYSETIKRLSEKLSEVRNSFDPPKKFSFKNRRKDIAKPDTAPDTSSAKPSSTSEQTPPSQQQQQHDTTQHDSSPSALSWKSHARITLPSSPHETSSPTVSHLTHCIVDLSAPTKANAPFAALYLRSISSSLIITGQVAGAIHITDVSNSIITTPEIEQSPNQWDQIDDFKWLKAEPSPHFSLLPEAGRISEDAWNESIPGDENESPDDTLKAFGVR
ncbi:hypothetical protein J4E89_004032 [Alternaria sp. Ai002NY15]|nr:hypothetical protein J4E89_004032 [Alternaria sp. Ai002NY15]